VLAAPTWVGSRLSSCPRVPNHYVAQLTRALTDGLVLTIEPIISADSGSVHGGSVGWTVGTSDGARAAHVEQTVIVRSGARVVLTA
jgi:methionyl aminopeptidase